MDNSRPEIPLDQLFDFRSGLSKPRSEFGSGYGFLSFKDVFYNIFVPEQLTELVNSTENERRNCSILRGDVFLTRTSETMDELGMSCVALKDYENATFNGFTKRLRPKEPDKIIPEYAGYFFRSPRFRRDVTSMSSLSTRASLNNEMLSRLKMILPCVDEQKTIGRILKTFDDKIDLNHQVNQVLEEMAQTIFKSWFIDFDDYNDLVDSELGPIPKGWSVRTLGELCEKPQYGYTASSQDKLVGPKFLRIKDINKLPWIEWSSVPYCEITDTDRKKYLLRTGDLVIARMADPGHGALIEEDMDAVFASYLIRFRPRDIRYGRYLQYWQRSIGYWNLIEARKSGTTRANLNAKVLAGFPLLQPPMDILEGFSRHIHTLRGRVIHNVQECQTLTEIRDTLLPKLISGEIRVPEAEKAAEEVL